ncbi:hypothetical protein GCM10011611_58280 [Aliidongia dinghuensis]|uniref:Filamentous haemagglutinin FhaB/tRNA nuclease CdiA-like TPS domain-containing protein n=1 Tax=Aliidongia dinghuensis TaxID=1867774 RepID=A0A8J2YZ69_9PROT|nr:filamentous haemagglutinin family protein [Aliidongia dinghuensis]GGF44197.1 hypothetical protein GCM10011611_58280 [Aliidongia dinghuensis]
MPVRPVASRSRRTFQTALLTSVSALTLFAAAAPAEAGNILAQSGAGSASSAVASAAASAITSAQQAATATQQARNSLARATQALQAMQVAESAARNLALQASGTIPGGLAPGGLQVAPNAGDAAVWQGANLPTQATSGGQTTVTIQQQAQKAILTWQSFNVSKNTTVHFDQTGGTQSNGSNNWIALNRIIDPSGVPSRILGSIKAEGSVYLINRNGIIFGGGAQVDTHTLIASSLAFLGETIAGLTPGSVAYDKAVAASNATFLNAGIAGPESSSGGGISLNLVLGQGIQADIFTDAYHAPGDITIEAGASITTHGNGAQGNGGYVLIAGTNVSNAGTVSTPDGQAILAAGIGVSFDPVGTNSSASAKLAPVLTGQLISNESGLDATPVSVLTNTGFVQAQRGTINLLGTNVAQNGVVVATTGVSYPGSITISALDGRIVTTDSGSQTYHRAGLVSFGAGSVTANLPEEDGETATSSPTASFTPGSVTINGGSIMFRNGSLLEAPGGKVTVATQIENGTGGQAAQPGNPTGIAVPPVGDTAIPGRIYIDNGATIDVAGLSDVELPVSATLFTIPIITQNELADSPLQRNSFLLDPLHPVKNLVLDSTVAGTTADGLAWAGSPILNATGYAQLMPRKIDQLLTNAGSITLAGNEVITASGSSLNLDGGYVHYLGGTINTAQLLDASGHRVDIGKADPNDTYLGFAGQFTVDHNRWKVSETFTSGLIAGGTYEADYIQGGNAGTLTVYGRGAVVLDGTLSAQALAGLKQVAAGRAPSGTAAGNSFLPTGGTFDLGDGGGLTAINQAFVDTSEPGHFIIQSQAPALASFDPNFGASTPFDAAALKALDPNDPENVLLWRTVPADALSQGGFANVTINPGSGTQAGYGLTVAGGTVLTLQPGGSFNYKAAAGGPITVLGSIVIPSGAISLESDGINGIAGVPGVAGGDITVGPKGVLSTAGLWVNDGALTSAPGAANFVNGGAISLSGGLGASIILDQGSLIDVSSGGVLLANGLLSKNGVPVGQGGSVSLTTWNFHSTDSFSSFHPATQPTTGTLVLDGTIRSAGFSGGGKLTLQALGFQIGGDPAAAPAWAMVLPADFFATQGFGSYQLNALYDATIADGTEVHLTQQNLIPNLTALAQAPSGTSIAQGGLTTLGTIDAYHRQATNLTLTAGGDVGWTGGLGGALDHYDGVANRATVGAGAAIEADAGASVTLGGTDGVTVLGTIRAPGGAITLTGDTDYASAAGMAGNQPFTTPDKSVWLGANAVLDVSGTTLANPSAAPVNIGGRLQVPTVGKVLAGGTVTLSDDTGYVVAEAGSIIDVSGSLATFDQPQAAVPGRIAGASYAPQLAWSDAGSITLGAGSGLLFDGTLKALSGAAQAEGGSLTLLPETVSNGHAGAFAGGGGLAGATGLVLQQSGSLMPAGLIPGQNVPNANPGTILFSADRLDGSGITTLVLGGKSANRDASPPIAFAGNVALTLGRAVVINASEILALPSAATSIPTLAAGTTDTGGAAVSITAPYVALVGRTDSHAASLVNTAAAAGDATLAIDAGFIDLQNQVALGNFGQASLASSGDIRLSSAGLLPSTDILAPGVLFTPGNLTLKAADLYPVSGESFILDAVGPTPTTITFLNNGASSTPLSAGGTLLVDATDIVQAGTIRAPSGAIVLGVGNAGDGATETLFDSLPLTSTQSVALATGSVTSVSLDGATVPYGVTIDGKEWQYAAVPNQTSVPDLTTAPAKVITVNGASVALDHGATVDLAGGGDLQAIEWVPGTGGSRNLLSQYNISYATSASGTTVPLYADARNVYAIVPGYQAPVAAYDPVYAQQPDPANQGRTTSLGVGQAGSGDLVGKAVYLAGVPGLPAGTYTLLPAKYATLPGAFRVVQNTGAATVIPGQAAILPDGTNVVSGYSVDALTGARQATPVQFTVQSAAAWGQYSQYTRTSANGFDFATPAQRAGKPAPVLPRDAGRLVLAATSSLVLDTTLKAAAAPGGAAAQVDIASQDIQITGTGEPARPGYLQLSAGGLDALGAGSLLVGGTRSQTASGVAITPLANSVVVSNDAADPLTGPEILLVTKTDPTGADANAANGLWVQSGSVIAARGSLGGSVLPITIGSTTSSGDGALLRVSNGGQVTVARSNVGSNPQGLLTVAAGASIDGGVALLLDSSGNLSFDPAARFAGTAIAVDAPQVTFTSAAQPTGLFGFVVGPNGLTQFASAQQVALRSYGAMLFDGDLDLSFGQTVDLSAGAFIGDGHVVLTAPKLAFTNEAGAPVGTASAGPGSLTVNAGELDLGTGAKAFSGFGTVAFNATNGIVGQGSGSFDLGGAAVNLAAPVFIAGTGSATALTTTGALVLSGSNGTALALTPVGGALSLKGGSIAVNGATISAPAGNVTLEATSGDLTLGAGSTVSATGVAKPFFDVAQYAPAGAIALTADQGSVVLQAGATLDFSGAPGGGAAGSLVLSAPVRTVELAGTIKGNAAPGYAGGALTLDTGGAVDLDNLAIRLATSGVDGAITVHSRAGNLTLSAGNTLKAQAVALTADGGVGGQDPSGGLITILGTIDASGIKGGTIALYGKSGVDLEGSLLATGSSATTRGGTVILGTVGTPDTVGGVVQLDPTYGYELVSAANSGRITLGPNAVIDVSGGMAGGLSGGTVTFRAPLLVGGDVNVAIASGAQIKGARATTLEAFATWSTIDPSTGAKHFNGIIDPAGWYGDSVPSAGQPALVAGSFADQSGHTLATWDGSTLTNSDGTTNNLGYYLQNAYFTPTTANADHQNFYGYVNEDAKAAVPGTLMGFIENGLGATPAFAGRFAGIASFQAAPGVDLVNPNPAVNGGNITVLTNWNLGAGQPNNVGTIIPAYRYQGTIAPRITFRAAGNFIADASITDGFFQSQIASVLGAAGGGAAGGTYAAALSLYQQLMAADDPASVTVQYVDGSTQPLTALDPNLALSAPLTGQASAYYSDYVSYANAWGTDISAWGGAQYAGHILAVSALRTPAPVLANYSSYQDYLIAYYGPNLTASASNPGGWLFGYSRYTVSGGLGPFKKFGTPTPPELSRNPADYPKYIQVYDGYLYQLTETHSILPTKPANAYSVWYAPLAPLSIPYTGVNIGNLPGNSPASVASPSNPLPVSFATLLGGQSSSYRIVAGADLGSADPLGVEPAATAAARGSGNLSLNGHFSYLDGNGQPLFDPTTIRTGTGSIDLAAANNVSLLDPVAPGVIYTAGAPAAGAPLGISASIVPGKSGFGAYDVLATSAVNPDAAGNISIHAGNDITGVESVTGSGDAISQFWWPWMQTGNVRSSNGQVTQASINFGAFDQGVMSVGGDVAISAGGNIQNLAVSLPTSWYLPNGGATVNTVGGGDLTVTAGGNILAGDYFVAKGTGTITAGGQIASGGLTHILNVLFGTTEGVSTILAVQDGVLDVTARQGADIGAIVNPSYIQGTTLQNGYSAQTATWLADAQSYSARSAVNVVSTTGAVALNSLTDLSPIDAGTPGATVNDDSNILPATVTFTAFNGALSIDRAGQLYPSATGQLSLIADQSISFQRTPNSNYADLQFGMIDASPAALPSPLNPMPINMNTSSGVFDFNLLSPALVDHSPTALHAGDSQPVRIYSLTGSITDGMVASDGSGLYDRLITLSVDKPAEIRAGQDITNLDFRGQNLRQDDITRIIAGRDIWDSPNLAADTNAPVPSLQTGGPGSFDVEAGRNIGPLTPSYTTTNAANGTTGVATGIVAVGNAIDPYLPHESADIDVLFGVGKGVANAAFIKAYVDPAVATPAVEQALVAFMETWDEGTGIDTGLKKDKPSVTLTLNQAWAEFQALPEAAQQRFNRQALFTVLTQVGVDYNDPSSSYYHQYARGYQAINTLFPAAMGYTANSLYGGKQGAETLVSTGDLDIRNTTIQTQQGGNIALLGPGGEALIGGSSAPPATGKSAATQGVLTLEQGAIDIFTDRSVLLAQSRIFTEQGGAITIWSSNGDINAGKGSKTLADVPPPIYVCDSDFYCTRDARGAVTGAGIATLQTIPGAPSANVETIAPRGTVDFGAAGIRSSGNLIVAAQFVANAANAQVQGQTIGVPKAATIDVGALSSASNAAGAAANAAADAARQSNRSPAQDLPSIITVEVIGYGGGESSPAREQRNDSRRRKQDVQSYDPDSAVHMLGNGKLTEQQKSALTEQERQGLDRVTSQPGSL